MRKLRFGAVVFVLCALVAPAFGASRMFIRFEGPEILGSSTDPEHSSEIEVLSWSHEFAQPDPRSTGTVESATHQQLTFTKNFDSATRDLLKYAWSGKSFQKVTIACYRGDGATDSRPVKYLEVVMEKVVIAGMIVSAGATSDVATETVSLDYGQVTYTYSDQKKTSFK